MRSIRRILNITWQDKVPNKTELERAGCTGMLMLLKQRRMRWLGHVVRMDDGRIPKDLLYGELVQGKRPTGRPQLRFKDVCKRDLKSLNIDQNNWEATALRRSAWRQTVQKNLFNFEETLAQQHREKRMRRKAAAHADRPASDFICVLCHRDSHSRIGLVSHTRRCTRKKKKPPRAQLHSLPRLKDAYYYNIATKYSDCQPYCNFEINRHYMLLYRLPCLRYCIDNVLCSSDRL